MSQLRKYDPNMSYIFYCSEFKSGVDLSFEMTYCDSGSIKEDAKDLVNHTSSSYLEPIFVERYYLEA